MMLIFREYIDIDMFFMGLLYFLSTLCKINIIILGMIQISTEEIFCISIKLKLFLLAILHSFLTCSVVMVYRGKSEY